MAPVVNLPTEGEPLVCRRVVGNGVVVATLHPVAGPVYWRFVDESDCNAPNYYGVTDTLELATVFKSGFYRGRSFASFQSSCLEALYEAQYDWDEKQSTSDVVERYSWEVRSLASKAGCPPAEIARWLRKAVWVEYPAPLKIHYLSDFNGYIGYRPEWSEDVEDALQWSPDELADKDDMDVELARSCGHFVTVSQARTVKRHVPGISGTNHALEADFAWTLHRLSLSTQSDASQAQSGLASWRGDLKETAWIHAARAGVDYVRGGEVLPVPEHITAFPELFERFSTAAALARHDATQVRSC